MTEHHTLSVFLPSQYDTIIHSIGKSEVLNMTVIVIDCY